MNLKILYPATAIAALSFLIACNNPENNDSTTNDTTIATETPLAPITITPVENSPEFPDAELGIKNLSGELQGNDSVKITIEYSVKNYELKSQTSDAATKNCNNSKDGQHIHFILNNQPYVALYEPKHTFTVALNSEHYLMSFLSRSYHESLKSPKAGVLHRFSIDDKGKIQKLDIPNTPMVFYSRPKGDYLGEDTKNLLLDFYVYNTTLGKDTKVKVDVNGTQFDIDKWLPYFIHNAPMGDITVKLQLTNLNGERIDGVHTSVERTSKLAEKEPIQ